jgi:predicted nucleic acid-binding protein
LGSIGVSILTSFLLLKRKGEIPAVRPVLDRMRQGGFGIAERLNQQALQAAGE